jgi:hypothetical protein
MFVCFATKAVHNEVVTSLTTEAFMAALRRFIARRDKPRHIQSDNGTNFQGAANQLNAIYKMLVIIPDDINQGLPGCRRLHLALHSASFSAFRGLWEASVKSMKHHLKRTLGAHIATYEELCTLLYEIEACLNSRPLCALSNDPQNPMYLSPAHFLIGESLTQLPSHDFKDVKCNRLTRWELLQKQLQLFWHHWSTEYLHNLQQRQKWHRFTPNLSVGDVVLLKDDNSAPLQRPMAVITEVHPGLDGNIRVVTIKTATGILKRPVTKICSLPHIDCKL